MQKLVGTQRESNIELLRILAIFFITIHHFCLHTAADYIDIMPVSNAVAETVLHMGGKLGVDIFVLITGYFQYNRRFRSSKLAALETQVWFYCLIGLVAYVILICNGNVEFTIIRILRLLFPVTFNAYWFITAYMGLYILTPFINLLLNHMDLQKKMVLITILLLSQSIFPMFFVSREWVNNLTLFIFIYIIGATVGAHKTQIKGFVTKTVARWMALGSFAILVGGGCAILFAAKMWIPQLITHTNYLANLYSPFILAMALGIFISFLYIDIQYHPWINTISARTLGVYLFQSNPIISGMLLWPFFEKRALYMLKIWPVIALAVPMLVFIVGILLDSVRIKLYSFVKIRAFDKIFEKIDGFVNIDESVPANANELIKNKDDGGELH